MITANAAPKKANHVKDMRDVMPKAVIPRTTKKLAPAFTPKILGEANGLFVIPCIIAPAIAKLAPTAAAMSDLGIRVS